LIISSGHLTQSQIQQSLGEAMLKRGWRLLSFSGLPKVYSKEEVVTPYYGVGEIRRTGDGWYSLGGYIGVIHQEFEEIWAARDENRNQQPMLPFVLPIANLSALAKLAYVRAELLEEDANQFAEAVDRILRDMPHSNLDLKAAFREGRLGGKQIETFSGWSQRQKFAELRQFVELLP
jgi:hypothetical protein